MFKHLNVTCDKVKNSKDSKDIEDMDDTVLEFTPLPVRRADTDPSRFLSPLTVAKFSEKPESPRHYFLRGGLARWSSTPMCLLPSPAPTSRLDTEREDHLGSFQKRLEDLDETTGCSSFTSRVPGPDSGYESLINHSLNHDSQVHPLHVTQSPRLAHPAEVEVSSPDSPEISTDPPPQSSATLDTNPRCPETVPLSPSSTSKSVILPQSPHRLCHGALQSPQRLCQGDLQSPQRLCQGAIPKRRSPRHAAPRQTDGLQKLVRPPDDRRSSGASLSSNSVPKASRGKSLCISKEGKEFCDIIRCLIERDLTHVLGRIYEYLPGRDLCRVPQVSQVWGVSLMACKRANEERLSFIAIKRLDRENFGKKLVLRSSSLLASPRRVMAEVLNCANKGAVTVSPGGTKRDSGSRDPGCVVSPSKVRHRLFVSEAAKLSPGERLVHCPLCTSPSRVTFLEEGERATCSSSKCSFVFCPLCQCGEHVGRGCRVTRTTSSKLPKSGTVTSKKSKARLRRL